MRSESKVATVIRRLGRIGRTNFALLFALGRRKKEKRFYARGIKKPAKFKFIASFFKVTSFVVTFICNIDNFMNSQFKAIKMYRFSFMYVLALLSHTYLLFINTYCIKRVHCTDCTDSDNNTALQHILIAMYYIVHCT